jgi:hypothetical protein
VDPFGHTYSVSNLEKKSENYSPKNNPKLQI